MTPPPLAMATLTPSPSTTVGIIGRGYISVVAAKLAALRGYETFMFVPPGQEPTILDLISDQGDVPSNLSLIASTDTENLGLNIEKADAFIIAVDDDSVMDTSVINFVLDPNNAKQVQRVVAMSRNLNGKGMNFAVKASKISANSQVWDMSTSDQYKAFEEAIRNGASKCNADYTIARAGTLKGGACGENEYMQYMSRTFYEMTKKDIVTWNLLFDCNVRGVHLTKGDVLPGPGFQAVFTATGTDGGLPGDTSRAGLAEAMVRSLEYDSTANMDFGCATVESREPPTDDQWDEMFKF